MLRSKRNKVLYTTGFILVILLIAVSLPVIYFISDQLSKTTRVRANILLVEGWLKPYAIEAAYSEFLNTGYDHVITTGIRISGYYQIYTNGFLIFNTKDIFTGINDTQYHTIEIDAYGELDKKERAHFNVFVNDSLVADFYAVKKKRNI